MAQRYKIVVSRRALADLETILDFYRTDTEFRYYASFVEEAIFQKLASLDTFPEGAPVEEKYSDEDFKVRSCHSGAYKIFYVVERTSRRVLVLRIVHQARDIKDLRI